MPDQSRVTLVLLVFQAESRYAFRDVLVDEVPENPFEIVEMAKGLLKEGEQLVLLRWGASALHVYLAQTGSIYAGREAGAIYRKCYYLDVNLRQDEIPDLRLTDAELAQLQQPAWKPFRKKTALNPKPGPRPSLAEIAEHLMEYAEALKALGDE